MRPRYHFALALLVAAFTAPLRGAVGDPQLKTDHPWYPGELACSTFERLFATQAALYQRVTGRTVATDEDKALAAWLWRNLHYAHGEDGRPDQFNQGFAKGDSNREYWHGLFAHGFGLCGTTHAQWCAEMNALLGPARGRVVGVSGHNSFEVYLAGGAYGTGKWALLDHDISTVIFAPDGSRLLSIAEIKADLANLAKPTYKPERQRGWRVAGLHDEDAKVYNAFNTVEYLAGYAGPPPMVHLRAGETLRRYLQPGLEDGKTFVYWGRNYNTKGIAGPQRDRTWVNQPEKMHGSTKGTGYIPGQARYGNAVYTYTPNFGEESYKQGLSAEGQQELVFEFYTPYVIGCTPPNDKPWGIYDAGGKNGLVISAQAEIPVQISTDQGKTWQDAGKTSKAGLDATDLVKGHQQYLLKVGKGAAELKDARLSWTTVCQCTPTLIPHLRDGGTKVTFAASGTALVSAGPNLDQAEAHLAEGKIGSSGATLELTPSQGGTKATRVYAACWQASGAPPAPVAYAIEYSLDRGQTWRPIVKDWKVVRRAPEPGDFWSQSFTWGEAAVPAESQAAGPVRVRFRNDGGKSYRRLEAHLAYQTPRPGAVEVTFAWKEGEGAVKTASREYAAGAGQEDGAWQIATGQKVQTVWVEYRAR